MKNLLIGLVFLLPFPPPISSAVSQPPPATAVAENLIIVTLDGFRWQEVFGGADPGLLVNERYTPDTATMQLLYGGVSASERRKKLLPFFWNVIDSRGQLFGNRNYDNKMSVANPYHLSYPGYSEMITGSVNMNIATNKKRNYNGINVFEYLNSKSEFENKVAVFSSWDVFPHIFNSEQNGLPVYSGYQTRNTVELNDEEMLLQQTENELVFEKGATRHDQLTFIAAKEHLKKNKPRVLFIGLGETDEMAHEQRYDLYLEKASQTDRMIAELWHWVQTTPGYKDNTILLITTDHGRGEKTSTWGKHGFFTKGSSETWMAVLGKGIDALGEIKEPQQLYQKQIAQTVATLLGEDFSIENTEAADAISIQRKKEIY